MVIRGDSTDETELPSHPPSHDALPIPQNLLQMALVLDPILAQAPPEDASAVVELRHKLSSGNTTDFRDLNFEELGRLAAYLAILSTELSRRGSSVQAHEIVVPDETDGGI